MKKTAQYAAVIVFAHALVAAVHGIAHQHLGISLTLAQSLFVVVVITLAPLIALLLLWTRLRKWGAALLLLSMLGSLIFGIVNHFLIDSSDHVLHLPPGEWRLAFQITAALLVITELWGCACGAWSLRYGNSVPPK